jgi:hypothetical protein
MLQAPWNLARADTFHIQVQAINTYGPSALSLKSNDQVIYSKPDAPYDLGNDEGITSDTQIGLTWKNDGNNGGLALTSQNVLMYDDLALTNELLSIEVAADVTALTID